MNKNDYTNMALHFYHASAVTTSGGALNISTSYSPTSFQSAEDDKGFVVMTKRRKPYSSGMVQGWGKFCFTGGIMEVRAKLPGAGAVGGLWPAMWLLGSLARATYVGSTDWIWPWSYDKCDRSLQPKQEINACEPVCKSNLQPDFNVSICDSFDPSSSALLRELDESDRFVQKSAESTSI